MTTLPPAIDDFRRAARRHLGSRPAAMWLRDADISVDDGAAVIITTPPAMKYVDEHHRPGLEAAARECGLAGVAIFARSAAAVGELRGLHAGRLVGLAHLDSDGIWKIHRAEVCGGRGRLLATAPTQSHAERVLWHETGADTVTPVSSDSDVELIASDKNETPPESQGGDA